MVPFMERLTREEVDRLADDIAVHAARIDAATHPLLDSIRRFDEAGGWAVQGARSCAHWLSWRIGIGLVAAREKVRVAKALAGLPRIDEALARGELSYAKVRAMTRVADAGNEDLLLHMARAATGADLERICAGFLRVSAPAAADPERRYVRRRHRGDGTVSIELRLLPDEADRVWQAMRDTRVALAKDASAEASPTMADAAVAMAERQLHGLAADPPAIRPAAERRQLFVHLREDRLTAGWQAELGDGAPIGVATLRRLACDSGLLVAKTDAAGNVLDVGRRRRTVSPTLLRALVLRDRRCQFPGCTCAAFVEAHHIEHWADGGATSIENMLLLCHGHHVAVHERGFRVERRSDGGVAFFDPDGRLVDAPPPPAVGGDEAAAGVPIDGRTALPRWDGSPADIGAAVSALMWRRERASPALQ
jgi:hypothetical protein